MSRSRFLGLGFLADCCWPSLLLARCLIRAQVPEVFEVGRAEVGDFEMRRRDSERLFGDFDFALDSFLDVGERPLVGVLLRDSRLPRISECVCSV